MAQSAENGTHLTLDVDRCGRAFQVSISEVNDEGSGHGYRIVGPKYGGDSVGVLSHRLTERDANEIRNYLDRVFPSGDRP